MDDWHERYEKARKEWLEADAVYKDASRNFARITDRWAKADAELARLFRERAQQVNA